jgi:hypothetical protein
LLGQLRSVEIHASGLQLELTFESGGEGEDKPDMSPGRKYVAGASFFDKATYPKLG